MRTNNPVNEAITMASSSLVAIMGRESAYTGQLVTRDDMMVVHCTGKILKNQPAQGEIGSVPEH